MATVQILVTEPGGSPVDITNSVMFRETSFEQQMNAVPGSFRVKVRDPDQVWDFHTGWEIELLVDGITMFGGYVTQVGLIHQAPAADTSDLMSYDLRAWELRGADYNIIFDRRVWRDTADYLSYIDLSAFTTDGAILTELVDNYADLSDFDSSGIEAIATIAGGDLIEQGQKLRTEFEQLSFFGAAVWYIAPDKTFIYKPYEDVEKRWGFSDVPNFNAITTSPASYQGALYPFREVEGQEDGSYIQNDALIWGGSKYAGSGGTVFARVQDATSQTTYGRWQIGETHFGDGKYAIQDQVTARANVIVNGPPGADSYGQQKGLRYTQWQFSFTWHSEDVPFLTGTPDHIVPGDNVTIVMDTFGVTKLLPVRTLRTTFPDAQAVAGDPNDRVVQFQATFGLQLSDPFTLWDYLLNAEQRIIDTIQTTQAVVTSSSTATTYGASFTGEPTPATDGAETTFAIPFGYISGTLQVYLNGLAQRPTTDFTESDNVAGEFTLTSAPLSADNLYVVCFTLEA